MQAIQTESVSGFRNNYKEALTKIKSGPILLLQNSKATAVLVSVEEWNTIAARLKRLQQLEALVEAKRISAEMKADPTKRTTHEELKRQLLEKRAQLTEQVWEETRSDRERHSGVDPASPYHNLG